MELDRRQTAFWSAVVFAGIAALLLVRIASFGIWDPWELNAADVARDLLDGETVEHKTAPLGAWLISASFRVFGVHEWSGRIPIALGGLLTVLAAWLLLRRFGGRRAAIYGALVVGTSPLFLFNSRQMLGAALAFAGSGFVAWTAASAAWRPSSSGDEKIRKRHAAMWLVGLVAAIVFAMLAGGSLLTVLPPLGAVMLVILLRGEIPDDAAKRIGAAGVVLIGAFVALSTVQAVFVDAAGYSAWLGGAPRGTAPPTFDAAVELIFHGFAPWSALAIIGTVRLLAPNPRSEEDDHAHEDPAEGNVRTSLVLWLALGYGALTLYTARYGNATYIPIVAAAAAVAYFLRDVEESKRAWWAEAIVACLFVGLLIRDFGLYPESPVRGLPLDSLSVPDVFNPKVWWALVLGLFAVAVMMALGTRPEQELGGMTLRGFKEWLLDHWHRGGAHRFWVGSAVALMALFLVFGIVCFIFGDALPLPSIVPRAGRYLTFVPLLVPIGLRGVPFAFHLYGKLGTLRLAPVLLAGALVGVYASQAFLPALSSHFSPREVYDTYNDLGAGEPLAEYRVNGRAAAYYARGDEVEDIETQAALLEWLGEREQRRWAVFPADELAALNRAWRAEHGSHMYIADARSARVVLACNQAIEGRDNGNFIAGAVIDELPEMDHVSGGRFGDKIELAGYDLDLPQDGYVGAGQTFTVTWYWRCLERVGGSYKIFLHVDGAGNRLNGDHEPVNERYPVRLWDEGDIIVDRQELTVPANYRSGIYTFWIGFFSGNNRLEVTPEDKNDGADRLNAGRLRVR